MEAKPLALIGLPGSGCAEVAAELARRSGRPVLDAASALDRSSSLSRLGHDLEGVIDAGTGLLDDPGSRSILRERTDVVWLDGPDAVLADRTASASLAEIRTARRDLLGRLTVTAAAIVSVERPGVDGSVAAVADAVERSVEQLAGRPARRVERVELDGDRGYPVVVGRGVRAELADHVPVSSRRVAVVTQPGVGVEVDSGREQNVFVVEDGEGAKRLDEVGRLASAFARGGLNRGDCVVSVGGGVVSDLAGFVAASYHRGVPVIHVSTTLLGQIDAAIGGKCGVNLPEGKNLVGAFWQPRAVLCDIDTLDGLPPREFRSGMGELAKYHFLGGGQLDAVEVVERVARSAGIKADVVSGDEREGGRRAILNYGHTLAHALETLGGYDLRHGEAVGIGLVHAAELAALLGRVDGARVAEHRRVVAGYGLDVDLPPGLDHDEIIDLYSRDKKAVDGLTFVLDGPSGVEPVQVSDRALLARALASVDPSVTVD